MDPLTDVEALQRMVLAMAAGAFLGFERERANKAAGLRTHMLVVEGATLFMIVAIRLSDQMRSVGGISDPGRIASTVVTGIGFIAAGVIITSGVRVRGLTTAAGIWVATAIGLLIGAGIYLIAVAATFLTVLALIALQVVERKLFPTGKGKASEPGG